MKNKHGFMLIWKASLFLLLHCSSLYHSVYRPKANIAVKGKKRREWKCQFPGGIAVHAS